MQVAPDLAQAHRQLAQLRRRRLELGREPRQRLERALGCGGERGGAVAVVGRDRGRRACRALRELGCVAHALPLGPERLLLPALEPLGALDELPQPFEAQRRGAGVPGDLVVALARGAERPPGIACVAPPLRLLGADEGVEHVELVRRAREPTLLELARHRDQPLGGGGEVLARDRAAPGVGARAAVGEDAAREHESRLVLRPQLRERRRSALVEEPLRDVELRLDVGLARGRADGAGVALDAEQQPDRLGEDRLAGPGLAAEHVQARAELELGLADEDEVLDSQAAQHRLIVDRRRARHTCPQRTDARPRPAPAPLGGSEALPVAPDERRLGERAEQRALLAEPDRHPRVRALRPPTWWPSTSTAQSTSGVRFQTRRSCPRGTTNGRARRSCGATNVSAIASRPHISTGPPFERL